MGTPPFKNILIVRTDRIGDVVLTIPAIRAIKRTFPDSKITVWVSSRTKDLVEGLPFVDRVVIQPPAWSCWGFWSFVWSIRQSRFDLAIIYHTKRYVNIVCFLAGIPCRLGYKNDKFGFLLNKPVKDRRHFGEKHEIEYCFDLVREIGVASTDRQLELPVAQDTAIWADHFLSDECCGSGPLVLIHPDATCPTRSWPAPMFAEVAQTLIQEGARVCVVGADSAVPLLQEMKGLVSRPFFDLAGKISVGQLAALLRRADLMISNDSGPAHVAAAVGTSLVTIFLRNQPGLNPERWMPVGHNCILLMNKAQEGIVLDKNSKILSGRLDSVSCQDVLAAARKLLAR